MSVLKIKVADGEYWWGGSVKYSLEQPYDARSSASWNVALRGGNQSAPLLLSTAGRFIHTDSPTGFSIEDGVITVEGENPVCVQAGSTLREAYLAASKRFFPFENKPLPEKFFRTAQYNTWMAFPYNPTQSSVLEYAHGIVDNGYKPGILMIDEGWSVGYGTWEFDFCKFPDPKAMIDELHALGFTVMLWVVPYVTPDGRDYMEHVLPWVSELAGRKFLPRLLRRKNGNVALLNWWDGVSAVYDLTAKPDIDHLTGRLTRLMELYDVDGFKFDAGNITSFAPERWATEPPLQSAEQLNKAWNDLGAQFEYHEYKDTYNGGGRATIQRVSDRAHSWDHDGLATLIPYVLSQGLLGYPYVCADMVGGGQWTYTLDPSFHCDEELFVRMAQCSALLPMMQFSWAPWKMLDEEHQRLCLEAAKLHERYADKIVALVKNAAATGEPVIRSLEYEYPHNGYERIKDQFMLGDDTLVCPVLTKGATSRECVLPAGRWRYCDGTVCDGGRTVTVPAPLSVLPFFTK